MKVPFKGQTKKDGYAILHDSFQQTKSSKKLYNSNSTEFLARVVLVISTKDPNEEKEYYIFASRKEVDKNTPEPEFYSQEHIREEHILGLKRYYPVSSDIEVPVIGQWIRVGIIHEQNQVGTYLGPYKNFEKTDIIGEKQDKEKKVSKTFEE